MNDRPHDPGEPGKLIDLAAALPSSGLLRVAGTPVALGLERILRIDRINAIHQTVAEQVGEAESDPAYFMRVLKTVGVRFQVDAEAFARIPRSGPLIVVANHPFGGMDGIVLGALLKSARADARLVGNYLLGSIRGMGDNILAVDPFERKASKTANRSGMLGIVRWLKRGGCIGTFPAGEVSSLGPGRRRVTDRKWSDHVVALAKTTGATVLPVFFEGRNSLFFQLAGLLHPALRTVLLPREFVRVENREMHPRIGTPIPAAQLRQFESERGATQYLRLQTYSLAGRQAQSGSRKTLRFPFRAVSAKRPLETVADPEPRERLEAEIASLPGEACLVEHGDFAVYGVTAEQIPSLLLEIGRLRESTFRDVREGTGRARDLDEFDDYYRHLFLWDRANREVVGAYRLGMVDTILRTRGKRGLYSAGLFKFRQGFPERLGAAIELGRSFIQTPYQKKHASLALIWRGIGEFLARHPQYRYLFEQVSITNAYQPISKDLMVQFFREYRFDRRLARMVRARNPPKDTGRRDGISLKSISRSVRSVDAISAIVAGFEQDGKGIPVLLRHYLKLNGVLLSFNVDPDFSDVIDGLILVDLRQTDAKVMRRYMGDAGYRAFLAYQETRGREGSGLRETRRERRRTCENV